MTDTTFIDSERPYTKTDSWRMFDRIAPRYDFLNRFLSFGTDVMWRKKLIQHLPEGKSLSVLDLATGTADVLLTLIPGVANISRAVGIDMSDHMLALGKKKIDRLKLENKIELRNGDANHIPFKDKHFHVATMAFGIRNVVYPEGVLREINRVLLPRGRALILEFSLPQNGFLKALYKFYLRTVVPFFGLIFSGDKKAYRYLQETVETFFYGKDFCRLMESAGFKNVSAYPITGGIATIYSGDKE